MRRTINLGRGATERDGAAAGGDQPAIVLAAFGTSSAPARQVYAVMDQKFRARYPGYEIAWGFISRKVTGKTAVEGQPLPTLAQALDRVRARGAGRVVIQSLLVVPGEMDAAIRAVPTGDLRVAYGQALLSSEADRDAVLSAIEPMLVPGVPCVIVTHGNARHPERNRELVRFAEKVSQRGMDAVVCSLVGEVIGTDGLARVQERARRLGRVHFVPLMICEGEHIQQDVMGESPGSFRSRVGAETATLAPALGYHDRVLDVFFSHLDEALASLDTPSTRAALPGHLYAVGVGPGAPDLITLRAVRLIQTADVVIAPRSSGAEQSTALAIVRPHLSGQEVIEHTYPMQRDAAKTRACWEDLACLVRSRLEKGQSVVHVTLGDPMLYSTVAYLLEAMQGKLPATRIHLVPGISAMQATATRFLAPLAIQDDRVMLMPATDLDEVERALAHCETLVLYKVGARLGALAEVLRRHSLGHATRVACQVEQPGKEVLFESLDEALRAEAPGYLSTVIVHVGRREWSRERSDARP